MDHLVRELLRELSDAKTWPEHLQQAIDGGSDAGAEIKQAGRKVLALEKRSQEAMKALGCDSPYTRKISLNMADMLISWYTFEDSLPRRFQ